MPRRDGAGLRSRLIRLAGDGELLAEHYPALGFGVDPRRGTAVAEGPIRMELPDGTVDPIAVRIEFGGDYPSRPPRVFDVERRWPVDLERHIFDGHEFCLYLWGVDEPNLRPPDALLAFMADVVLFLRQQLICDSVGRFPGPTWPHGKPAAYATYILESLSALPARRRTAVWHAIRTGRLPRNGRCLCGSHKKLKRCHLDAWRNVERAARQGDLRSLTLQGLEGATGGR